MRPTEAFIEPIRAKLTLGTEWAHANLAGRCLIAQRPPPVFDTIGSRSTARSRLPSLVVAFSALSHCLVGGVAIVLFTAEPVLPSFLEPPCAELTMTRLTLRWPMPSLAARREPGPSVVAASLRPSVAAVDGGPPTAAQTVEGDAEASELGNDFVPIRVGGGVCGCVVGGLVSGLTGGLLPPGEVEPLILPRLPSGPLRAGAGGPTPVKVVDVEPVYPRLARAARIQGVVILDATIDETGRVVDIRVLRSIAPLEHAAIEAVKQWRYMPAVVNGRAVAVVMTITTSFRL